MRLLHTSDWHLGRKLYDRPRLEEQKLFLDWLLKVIQEQAVEVLLLAGDVFDTSVPSAKAMDLFYDFLFQFYEKTSATAVIISGNHDSATRLAAPREFLKIARIHLIGAMPNSNDDHPVAGQQYVIPIQKNNEEIAVVALPYLPEGEILSHVSFEEEIDSARRYREAIRCLYARAVKDLAPEIPQILMGHFFMGGGKITDSERTIQVGGSLPVTPADLPATASYAALGHLHRPQQFKKHHFPVVYSGSPIPLTFQEAEYDKKVFLVDTEPGNPVKVSEIVVPVFRPLVRVSGTFEEIMNTALSGDWAGKLIEVTIELSTPQVGLSDQIRQAFAEQAGEVASVQALEKVVESENELSAEEVTSQSTEEIFRRFYFERQGEPADPEAETVFADFQTTFHELMALYNLRQTQKEDAE